METEQINSEDSQKKIHINWDKVYRIVSVITLVISIIFMSINIYYTTVLMKTIKQLNEPHQEIEVVETVDSTAAPDDTIDILPIPEETKPTEGTKPATEPTTAPSEPTSAPVTEETKPTVNQSDVELLACVIYQEAGGNGSCDNCRRYVADVVLNRVNSDKFPNDIHSVLTAKGQYGNFYYTGVKWPARAEYDTEKAAVKRAYRIAKEVLSGKHSDIYGKGYVWQAGFVQGTDGFWCCGTYFGKG